MRLIDLDDDRHVYTGDMGDYENWNIDPDAVVDVELLKKALEELGGKKDED